MSLVVGSCGGFVGWGWLYRCGLFVSLCVTVYCGGVVVVMLWVGGFDLYVGLVCSCVVGILVVGWV